MSMVYQYYQEDDDVPKLSGKMRVVYPTVNYQDSEDGVPKL
jgi:hypothetical protein